MSDELDAARTVGELAFEHDIEEAVPGVLWCVRARRPFSGRLFRWSAWFATEERANAHVVKLTDSGAIEITVTRYVQS